VKNAISVASGLLFGGGLACIVSLVGYFDTRLEYCDTSTQPCTKVVAPVWWAKPTNDFKVLGGSGLIRTIAAIAGASACGVACLLSSRATEERLSLEQSEAKAKALDEARTQLIEEEELKKVAIASEMRVKEFKREVVDAHAQVLLENRPDLQQALLKQAEPESEPIKEQEAEKTDPIADAPELQPTTELEVPKIPKGIDLMLDSDLREIADAGILNLVGGQGCGKTSTGCMLLRYRAWKGHKLLIVNPHKKKSMYAGIDSFLLPKTTFYGVGKGDLERAESLLDGLQMTLSLLEKRYDEYQNLDELEYDHFPVTILLEECAEYDGLLSIFNRPPDKEGDPGFSAKKYLTQFWKKVFVATRKGNCYLVRTLQSESNTMNGTEGLSELIKSSGACTLVQFSVPDGNCIGGWRSTGEGEIKIPNHKYFDEDGKLIDAKKVSIPTYFDYIKVMDRIDDFTDLLPPEVQEEEAREEPKEEAPAPTEPIEELPENLLRKAVERLNQTLHIDTTDGKVREIERDRIPQPESRNEPESTEPEIRRTLPQKTYTPSNWNRDQTVAKIEVLRNQGRSQTKIIEELWQVRKNGTGWKKAYNEYKDLTNANSNTNSTKGNN
jgi:hypothetical protein